MTFSVAVAGASGYAGGEALRILSGHPEARIETITANANAGTVLGQHHPHLRALADRVLTATTAEELAGHDVVVLALPHGASARIAAELPAETVVLDLGADHRLVNAAEWQEYYGSEHAGTWPYGLPELIRGASLVKQRERLRGATRIAVPGCNVTAVTLGLQPGAALGLIDLTDLVAVLAVGYSGAGKALKPNLLAAEALSSLAPYAVGGSHRHIPEIAQNLRVAAGQRTGAEDGRWEDDQEDTVIPVRLSFTPVLAPVSRGILATATARLAPGVDDPTTEQLHAQWQAAYADEPFVTVLPLGQWPTTGAVVGANTALVQVAWDAKARRVVTVTAIDNLVKGTAGGAVQSLNIALGLPESMGLTTQGVAP